jgi:hypothetical protein
MRAPGLNFDEEEDFPYAIFIPHLALFPGESFVTVFFVTLGVNSWIVLKR